MAIEFQCPACQAILRVPDDAAGKQAKCPRCGQVVTVLGSQPRQPDSGIGPAVPPPPSGPTISPGSADFNPYAPPQTQVSYMSPVDRGVIEPQIISFGETFNITWRLFFDNMGPYLGMGAMVFGISFLMNILTTVANVAFVGVGDEEAFAFLGIFMFLVLLLAIAVNLWLQGGMLRYSIELAKGMRPSFGRVFLPINLFLGYLAVSLILGLVIFAGFVLLIIPGIILMLMFYCAPAAYLDGKAGIMEAFTVSRNITRGNRLTILGLMLANMFLALVAIVVTCGLAGLLTAPFFNLLIAVIYTRCAGLFASARPAMAQASSMAWVPASPPNMQ